MLNPAAAFGDVLVRRLRAAGMRFDDDVDLEALPGAPDGEAEAAAALRGVSEAPRGWGSC